MAAFGRFSPDGREYIIDQPFAPPRHLVNFSWNETLISGVNQFGTGEGVFNNQTLLYNHPDGRARMVSAGRRYFYLRDDETGTYWNLGSFPVKHEPCTLTTVVGMKYTRFIHETEGVQTQALCFVAPDEPVEIWQIVLTNPGSQVRRLRIYPYVEWLLQGYPASSDYFSYLKSEFHPELNTITGSNTSDERPHARYTGFLAADAPTSGYTGSAREFMGVYGEPTRPKAVQMGQSANRPTSNEVLAGSLEVPVLLGSGETTRVCFLIGNTSEDIAETGRMIRKLFAPGAIENAFEKLLQENDRISAHTRITTPDEHIDRLVNHWAKNQVQLCAEFGRDGARGFRDTLQDAWGVASFRPDLARAKILEALRFQRQEGWALRGWMPLNLRRYSDGPTWIAPALAGYIQHSGDASILEEVVPYYDGGSGSVLQHLLAGVRHLLTDRGEHRLCLAHRGDWNDSLDWMGQAGRGESVMTSMGLYHTLCIVEELAIEVLHDETLAEEMRAGARDIQEAVEANAWDGAWYLQGFSDRGNPVGSRTNAQGQITLPPQAWAVYSGIAAPQRQAQCIQSVLERLESEHGCLVSSPAYTRLDENVGRLTVILPGTYENASPYCHGTAFMIAALLKAGRPADALRLYEKVTPDNRNHPSSVSGAEPYAFTNQYLGPENLRAGQSISGWITGTAGWMYNIMVRLFFGFQPSYHGVLIRPCFPPDWPAAELTTRLRGTQYHIHIHRTGASRPVVLANGREMPGGWIPHPGGLHLNVDVCLE